MQIPQIRLESQMAQINIQQSSGKQEIQQPKADLSIQQPKADLSIRTTDSKLTIDQTQAWEDMNLMSTRRRIEKFAQEGHNGLLEGMARRAQQGTALMKIENKGNPIIQQAMINGHDQMKSLGIKFIPSPFAVKIHYQPSEVQINAKANKPIVDAKANKVEHSYERGIVDIRMEQYQQLKIDFVNLFSETV